MNKMVFGKYINNHSVLTRLDARVKLLIMIALIVFCFLDFSIYAYLGLLFGMIIITLIGKLSFKPILNLIRHMWFLMLILLVINVFTITGKVLFTIGNIVVYEEALFETLYIFIRLVLILMISNLLTATTSPNELTYALEFYLTPLKIFKVNVNEMALMMSIALRFIPTLFEEINRIKNAQMSRGVDFEHGRYFKKLASLTSIVVPLFISCFERADDLSDAMIVKGYGIGKRSKYKRLSFTYRDVISLLVMALFLTGVCFLNGVVL